MNISDNEPQKLGAPWIDISSYSQNCKARVPHTWLAKFGFLTLEISKDRFSKGSFVTYRCRELGCRRLLRSDNVGLAADKAMEMLRNELERALSSLDSAVLRFRRESNKPMHIHLLPSAAVEEGETILKALRAGHSPATSNLEALDEVLRALSPEEAEAVKVVSHNGPMTVETAKRLRFERGFDIRPKAAPDKPTTEPKEER